MGWLNAVSIAGKVIVGAVLGVAIASACFKLGATRNRNAKLTPIRYTEPFRWSATVQIAGHPSISPDTTNWRSATGEPYGMGF